MAKPLGTHMQKAKIKTYVFGIGKACSRCWVCSLSKSTLLELGSIDTSYHAGFISVGNVSQNKLFMTGSSVIQGRIVLQFSK